MPVLGNDEKENFRVPLGNEITKELQAEFGNGLVLSPNEFIARLIEVGLADDYANAITLYDTSGIIPKELLNEIGKWLGVEYLLYVKLLAESDVDYPDYGNYGHQRIEVYELYSQTQVWSTELGDVVWEGKGGCAVRKDLGIDFVIKSAEGISKIIGNEKNDGPCESTKEIFDSYKKGNKKAIGALVGGSIVVYSVVFIVHLLKNIGGS